MGGSGGGGGFILPSQTNGFEQGLGDDTCLSLQFTTNLHAISGAPMHGPPTQLRVVPTREGGGTTFVAVNDDGRPIGTIVENVGNLLTCTERGVSYVAEVQKLALGVHTVHVRAIENDSV